MQTSLKGVQLIESFEGLRNERYDDGAGNATIGYGHKVLPTDNIPTYINQAEADFLLRQDLRRTEISIYRNVKVPLNQNQYDALVSFIFNLGTMPFTKGFGNLLNSGDYQGAAARMPLYNKMTVGGELVEVAGLKNRRLAEQQLFLTEV
jgi:lysozyme